MRDRGTFNFSGNLEVKKDAPLEARSLVNSYADLVKPETWTDEQGGIWKYDCMLVSCKDRPGEVYQLQPGADYTKQSSWILIGDTSELNSKVQQFINSKGAPNGLASLNESGIIPSAQLPSYVDVVIEVDTFSNLPGTGESGKIYIVQDTNLTYRWSGTDYVEISKSLALGETSSTAYPGDKGKATTDKLNRIPDKLITDTVNVNQSTTEAVLNFTTYRQEAQQIGRNTLTITSATTSQAGLMSSSDKTKLDGKVIDVPNGSYLTLDKNATGTEAIEFINNIFGSTDRLKEVVMDIIEHHQKYLFHSYGSNVNCLGISNVYAYYEYTKEEYNFQYNVSYYTTNGPVSKRMAFKLMPNNEDCVAISEDLLPDWHSIKNVLNDGNEFNFADGEVGERVWLNYRSRSGNTVSAGKLYIGDGQATGGFAEVHASGFFKESDVRLKSNIAPLNHTLDQICNIPTVEFDMHDKHQIGTIAQDLENNFAEVVNTDSDGMKSVDYCMLGVVAIEGIKLLKQEVEDLKKQIEELKNGK